MEVAEPVQIRLGTPNMTSNKKVLLISATAGAGHIRAAEALLSELQTQHPEITAEHINLMDYSHPSLRFAFSTAYNFSIQHSPFLYEITYKLSNNKISGFFLKSLASFLRITTGKYRQKIKDFQPDIIISTYFFSSMLLPPTDARVYTVITDYQYHQAWFNKQSIGYFVANEEIKNELKEKNNIKITVSGIPINPIFLQNKNTDELKKTFGINNQLPIILILPCKSGSIAPDAIIETLSDKPYNIIAVAGKNNPDVYQRFLTLKKETQNFWPLPYSDKIDELMRMSNIIITKAGGITVTECLHLGKPLLIVNPIPGQEIHNTEMIIKNHYGIKITELSELNIEIPKILNNSNYLQKAKFSNNPNSLIIETVLSP